MGYNLFKLKAITTFTCQSHKIYPSEQCTPNMKSHRKSTVAGQVDLLTKDLRILSVASQAAMRAAASKQRQRKSDLWARSATPVTPTSSARPSSIKWKLSRSSDRSTRSWGICLCRTSSWATVTSRRRIFLSTRAVNTITEPPILRVCPRSRLTDASRGTAAATYETRRSWRCRRSSWSWSSGTACARSRSC